MRVLYPKAAFGTALALLRRLPSLGPAPAKLPVEELVLEDAAVDRDRLAGYCRVCTFEHGECLPPTYPQVLAFPLAMKLMTATSFPFPVVGLVHIRNVIAQRRPIRVDERLTLRVRAEAMSGHDRGTQFDVVAEAEADGDPVWSATSTYLHRERSGGSSDRGGDRPDLPQPLATWAVPSDIGRRYAAVSGDRNPIHLHALSARLFGLPRHIAHGMWAKARCLAVLDSMLPAASRIDVSFKLPVLLPARVTLATWTDDGVRRFALHDDGSGKPHLAALVEPLS